jgi:four helix bundle protein
MGEKNEKQVDAKFRIRITDHRKMIVWQSIDELDIIVQKILANVPKKEYKIRAQIDSASDSIGANFVEGYYSGFLSEYLRFLSYCRRSLGELQERVRRLLRKQYLDRTDYDRFAERAAKTLYLLNRLIYALKEKQVKQK